MWFVPKRKTTSVPQMVENCEQSSKVAAKNLATLTKRAYEGRVLEYAPLKSYRPDLHGAMVSLGAKHGVAYIGVRNLMLMLPSFPTQLFKRAINVVYLAPVLGPKKLPTLLAHEFLARRKVR